MEVRIIAEDQLEAAYCEECGSGNIFNAPSDCKSCADWRDLLNNRKES